MGAIKQDFDAIEKIEAFIDALTKGDMKAKLPDSSEFPVELRGLAERLGILAENVSEFQAFVRELSHGNLDVDPPGRRNYLAAPAKELHSQLSSFSWSIRQLSQGNMVSKLYYPGEIFEHYNALVEKVAQTFGAGAGENRPEWGSQVSSWRYHQLLSAINQLRIMLLEVGSDGTVIFANPPARKLFDDIKKLPYDLVEEQTPLMRHLCAFSGAAERLSAASLVTSDFPILREIYDSDDGTWYKITTDCVQLTDGSYGFLHVIDDISEWKRNEIDLKLSAAIDPLTNAYTRKEGFKKLEEMISRRDSQPSCVAFADIDSLKAINDEFGHIEGDFAIKTIVDVIMSCMRSTDCVVRYGGDEFLMLFMGCTLPVAKKILERIKLKLDEVNNDLGKGYKIGFSVGITEVSEDINSTAELIRRVDELMYAEKIKNRRRTE